MKTPILLFLASLGLMALLTASSPETIMKGHGKIPFTQQIGEPDLSQQVWPGMIVIKFKEGAGMQSITDGPVVTGIGSVDEKIAAAEATGLVKRFRHKPIPESSGLPDLSRIYRLTFPEHYDPVQIAALFSKDANIEYAEPEPRMQVCEVPNDPMYPLQQHLPQVMAAQAWDIHKGENGTQQVKIAIVDTGVEWYHQDLSSNVWQNLGEDADGDGTTVQMTMSGLILDPGDLNGIDDDGNGFTDDLIGWDFYNAAQTGNGSNPDPNPGNSAGFHGTHCAGIAAAATNNSIGVAGISWNLKYMALQTDINNNLPWAYDGIIYAADMGADVISNSWGGFRWTYSEFIADVLAYASGQGSILVFAAGNDGDSRFFFPACYPGAIGVASVNGDDTKVSYSNYGPGVDVSAPGGGLEGGILSTWTGNGYELAVGTSMATPLMAGLLGLVKSYQPEWTKEQVIGQVLGNCDNIDALNPLYQDQLGNGRINAYQALAATAQAPQELKLELWGYDITDFNNNGILSPGESGAISLKIRNYTHLVSTDAVNFTLSTDDDQIEILAGTYTGVINSDSIFDFTDIMTFSVSPQAVSHTAILTLNISADIPVIIGGEFTIPVTVAPSGFLVYEKYENGRDQSGAFIRQYLEDMGYGVTYSNHFPHSLMGYEAVFLSMGNLVFPKWDPGTFLTQEMMDMMIEYLQSGGRMYLEGAGVFLIPQWATYANAGTFRNLFGISGVSYSDKNPVDNLSGVTGTLCEGMEFTVSSQYYNNWIEKLYPMAGVHCPLQEFDHGNVAVYNTGSYGQKTFYFAYSLADLKDVDQVSSRYNLMNKVMTALGYNLPPGYMIANFKAGRNAGGTNTAVQFQDLSMVDFGITVNSWQWDFQNDGTVDSYLQNPVFTFTGPGTYDVRLVISNGGIYDTIIQQGYYTANKGIMVYEAYEGCRDMSGAWIRDFLLENDYGVTYVNEVPRHIDGFDALFLSFGSYTGFSSIFEDGFVRLLANYLPQGGKVYLEGSAVLGMDQANSQAWALFGLQVAVSPANPYTTFDSIAGLPGSICEGISFNGTSQLGQFFTDRYFASSTGVAAFDQPSYGNVAVQRAGANGEKTFCFAYILAELQDGESTREELMWAILNYFDIVTKVKEPVMPAGELNLCVYPVPANGTLTVSFHLPSEGSVAMEIYDLSGRVIFRKNAGTMAPGLHLQKIEISYPSGIYLLKIQAGNITETRNIILTDY